MTRNLLTKNKHKTAHVPDFGHGTLKFECWTVYFGLQKCDFLERLEVTEFLYFVSGH